MLKDKKIMIINKKEQDVLKKLFSVKTLILGTLGTLLLGTPFFMKLMTHPGIFFAEAKQATAKSTN